MATFKFRFEAVLRQRQLVEDECQRDLAKLLRQRMIVENQLRQMQQTISQSKHDLGDALVGRVDLEQVGHFARYSAQAAIRAQQIVRELARLEQQIEKARLRLADAMRMRKAMELLRDREYEKWKRERERREAIELDDMANQAYARQMMIGATT